MGKLSERSKAYLDDCKALAETIEGCLVKRGFSVPPIVLVPIESLDPLSLPSSLCFVVGRFSVSCPRETFCKYKAIGGLFDLAKQFADRIEITISGSTVISYEVSNQR